MNKAIFLDRDGVINENTDYLHKKEDLIFISNSLEALKKINKSKYKVIIITNQSGIARGYFTLEQFHDFNKHFMSELNKENIKIDGEYFCPHHPDFDMDCSCRKPKPGMLLKAKKEFNIDLKNSWMIGDDLCDILAGKNAGCKTILVETGHAGKKDRGYKVSPDFKEKDLYNAVELILKGD
ncbi:MAG: D-glycero-beta-D-manno-heptose 1,7-bisphosphate 7-phosphatase [Candidatus Nanoarchaeia archaeon]|nr:D-glycero-beta-D-manno-heptose 1,7-bisphosphate 7-phosphatase [Candidatus Nanoarchaeia archaeon]